MSASEIKPPNDKEEAESNNNYNNNNNNNNNFNNNNNNNSNSSNNNSNNNIGDNINNNINNNNNTTKDTSNDNNGSTSGTNNFSNSFQNQKPNTRGNDHQLQYENTYQHQDQLLQNPNDKHHESIRNLIASNFKQSGNASGIGSTSKTNFGSRNTGKQNTLDNQSTPGLNRNFQDYNPPYSSNLKPSNLNSSLASSSHENPMYAHRKKSNSISNGVLAHNRTLKKVSFSNFNSGSASAENHSPNSSSISSSNISFENSDAEDYDDDDDHDDNDDDDDDDDEHAKEPDDNDDGFNNHDNDRNSEACTRNSKVGNARDNRSNKLSSSSAPEYEAGDVVLRKPDFQGSDNSSQKSSISKSPTTRAASQGQFFLSNSASPADITPNLSQTSLSKKVPKTETKSKSKSKSKQRAQRHSYGGEKLALSKSLDSTLLEPCDSNSSTTSLLPEFNKRPLTDTPIVSNMGSPISRELYSDDYDYEDDEGEKGETNENNNNNNNQNHRENNEEENGNNPRAVSSKESESQDSNITQSEGNRVKRISHLNLAELNDNKSPDSSISETESLSHARNAAAHVGAALAGTQDATINTGIRRPSFVPGGFETTSQGSKHKGPKVSIMEPDDRSGSVSPMSSISETQKRKIAEQETREKDREIEQRQLDIEKEQERLKHEGKRMTSATPPENRSLTMNKEIKDHLLKDVPADMKEQFEKTPSIEKLKNLLMTKPPPSARKTYTLNIPGQTSSKTSPDGKIASVDVGSKLVIVMVGLPARGKSYITNKLTRYLNWLQHDCRVFNVGNTRRKSKLNAGPEKNPLPDSHTPTEAQSPNQHQVSKGSAGAAAAREGETAPVATEHDASFFNPENKDSTALREKWAMDTLEQLLDYVINGSGSVGIFDATNSTKMRRKRVLKRIQERSGGELKVLFLESICSDPSIIESNIRLKLSGPDYKNMDPELALKDFVGRLHNYEKAYETIDEEEEKIPGYQYIKMIDVGKKVVSYNIQGFLSSQTVYFLLNFNLCERQIWITRHGESKDNLSGKIGGDSHLTKRGLKFSKALAKFMNFQRQNFRKQQLERFSSRLELKYNSIFNEDDVATLDMIPNEPNFCVWTSMLVRSVETGQYFNDQLYSVKQMRMLNELGGGKYEGMTYDEIQRKHPREFDARLHNKLTYRYPGVGGESYLDVLTRLRPLITELERTTDHLLIISHRVVLRILLAYFLNLDKSAICELDVPLHTLYCLESKPYGTDYTMYEYDEATDWFVKAEPEHQKNFKEVGVVFRERKYSIVPTAPPSRNRIASHANIGDQLHNLRHGHGHGQTQDHSHATSNTASPVLDRSKMQEFNNLRNSFAIGSPTSMSTRPTLSVRDGDDQAITAKNLQDLKNLEKSSRKSKVVDHE